jgi:hypothetical protein
VVAAVCSVRRRAVWREAVGISVPSAGFKYAYSANFQPVTGDEQLAAAEAAGEFAVINPGAPDPHQIWTSNVLICPVVMQHTG